MKRKNDLPEALTITEVAKQLHCHPVTVRRAIAAGRIQVVKVSAGRLRPMMRIPTTVLESMLKGEVA